MSFEARLGRPPDSSSAETRERIVEVARRSFASVGFEATTNRTLAQDAGITTGAIYHYFDAKLDIYVAVNDEVQRRVYQRLVDAEAGAESFYDKVAAVLEAAAGLNAEDPSLARFIGAARIDRNRIPEINEALGGGYSRRDDFFNGIVQSGVDTGEIHKSKVAPVRAVLHAFTVGLTDGLSDNTDEHRLAIEGIKILLKSAVADGGVSS